MINLIGIILFLLFLQPETLNEDIKYYEKAIEIVSKSKEFENVKLMSKDDDFYIHSEVFAFKNFALFFTSFLSLNQKQLITATIDSKSEIYNNKKLLNLNKYRSAKNHFFVSSIENDFFFVELIPYHKSKLKYKKRPKFGITYVFLFKIQDSDVDLINVKEIAHN